MTSRWRHDAAAIFAAGVKAAHPGPAVARALSGQTWEGPVQMIAFGKAACSMADAALAQLPPDLVKGEALAVTDAGNASPHPGLRVMVAGHPLPDEAGLRAAAAVTELLRQAGGDTTILALVSGGSSSLLPAPVPGVTLADKMEATRLLLACGAPIDEINTVRKHLSTLKGGFMASLAFPARIRSLILSDVPGDDPGIVGSGPTVPDPTTFTDALSVIDRYRLTGAMPPSVIAYLQAGAAGLHPETPKPSDPVFAAASYQLVGGPDLALAGSAAQAEALGYRVVLTDHIEGEARQVGEKLARVSGDRRPAAFIWAGETTVTVTGGGRGGRNQELALAFALAAAHPEPWVLVAGGTDGRDGPTDAAGGIVDPGTIARIQAAGLDPRALLEDNDSHRALAAASDLLVTGPTGTNVADLVILLLGS